MHRNPRPRRAGAPARIATPRLVFVVSLGCPKNLVDTEVMCGGLALAGYVLTDAAADADVMLVNTCSFVADARTEATAEIVQALRWKRQRQRRRVVVAGCLPQRNLAEARERFPEVDLFLGVNDVPRAAALISAMDRAQAADAGTTADQLPAPTYLYDDSTPRLLATPGHYAYVKIADGCDHFCRFCSIPYIRGRQRSRSLDSVVAECRNLLAMGVKELNLVAQDTTRYGSDRDDGANLPELLRRCDALDGRFWIRLLYTHPKHFTTELMDVFAGARHLLPYVDIPLQHISDRMLQAMGRGLGEARTRELMRGLRQRIPRVAVRTTFLVGYPGETEADFVALCEFVREYRFERLGAFAFSPEAGTAAARIREGLVPASLAQQRRGRLLEIQQGIALAQNQARVGELLEVLVDRSEKRGRFAGRALADAPEIDNAVHFRAPARHRPGDFALVRVTAARPYDLEGRWEADAGG